MLGLPVREFFKHPVNAITYLAADPLQIFLTLQDEYAVVRESKGRHCQYEVETNWEKRLHGALGVPWPCSAVAEFWEFWPSLIGELKAKGIDPGPKSFQWWNDGDAGLVRSIWCLVHHLKPRKVVETGVGHGVTSRCILEALKRSGDGCLWSIDLPLVEAYWRKQVGIAVGAGFRDRWTYIAGSSRRHLPELLSQLGQIDLFVHDSLHSERNLRFELDRAWVAMGPGGAIVVDDVDANWGLHSFRQTFPIGQSFICEAEVLRPDMRRFNQKGLFGILLKQPPAVR
jgi:hypothetical protein